MRILAPALALLMATCSAVAARAASSQTPTPAKPAGCIASATVEIDPAAASLHLGTQSYPQTLNLCDHQIVLTFDDGPWPSTTPLILDALREAGLKATFFLIGRNTCLYPQLARQELAEGHTVGHHSNTHPSFTLRGFDEASAERDIGNGIAADEQVIYGLEARPDHPHVPFFRFPGFADTDALLDHLDDRDIAVFGSDLWAGDWIAMSPGRERERILALLERRPLHNGIILFHDTKVSTARMLPGLLRDLKARGYHFVQPVVGPDAPAPPLTAPLEGPPETQTIIANLPRPIVPGSHRLPPGPARACPAPGEGRGARIAALRSGVEDSPGAAMPSLLGAGPRRGDILGQRIARGGPPHDPDDAQGRARHPRQAVRDRRRAGGHRAARQRARQ